MFERLIENWLTNVNELGLQLPFCEMLLSRGFRVLHISRHSRGEHGKDIVARAGDGRLWAFQMKGGDITFTQWRNELRGQIEDLVRLPVLLPGVPSGEPHIPVLVTNGELRGDAIDSVRHYATVWEQDGSGALQVWQRPELLSMFVEAHETYLPTQLSDFRKFVELYVADGEDRLPRAEFAGFLTQLIAKEETGTRRTEIKRGIESMVLLGAYVLEQYERSENYVSAAEGWTMIGSTILHVAERENLSDDQYVPSLNLAWIGLERALNRLQNEVMSRKSFVEPAIIFVEPYVYGARVCLVLGWLSVRILVRRLRGESGTDSSDLLKIVKREAPGLKLGGEADWSSWLALSLFLHKEVGAFESESMLERWVRWLIQSNRPDAGKGVPNPYWLQEKVLAWYAGELPNHEEEEFSGQSYTALSALDLLVGRLRRQTVRHLWPAASQLQFVNFSPDCLADWFLWKCSSGETRIVDSSQPRSWSEWREEVSAPLGESIPARLIKHREWILPFAMTYPHRVNRIMSALIDRVFRQGRI